MSTGRCAWCCCRVPRPTWSRRSSRSPAARWCAGQRSPTSGPPLQMEEAFAASAALAECAEWHAALERRGIDGPVARPDRPVAGGHVRAGAREGPPHLPVPGLPAGVARRQRLRPAARGADGLSSTWAGARCSRSSTTASCRSRPSGELLPRGQRAAAHRSASRSRSPSPRARASRWTAIWCAGRSGRCGSAWTRSRAWSSRRRLRGRRAGAADPLPGLGQRDGGALRGPGPHARVEERVRRR